MGFSFAAFINIFGPRLVKRGLCAEGQRTNSGGDDAIARSRWNREVINEFFYVEFTAVSHDDALRISSLNSCLTACEPSARRLSCAKSNFGSPSRRRRPLDENQPSRENPARRRSPLPMNASRSPRRLHPTRRRGLLPTRLPPRVVVRRSPIHEHEPVTPALLCRERRAPLFTPHRAKVPSHRLRSQRECTCRQTRRKRRAESRTRCSPGRRSNASRCCCKAAAPSAPIKRAFTKRCPRAHLLSGLGRGHLGRRDQFGSYRRQSTGSAFRQAAQILGARDHPAAVGRCRAACGGHRERTVPRSSRPCDRHDGFGQRDEPDILFKHAAGRACGKIREFWESTGQAFCGAGRCCARSGKPNERRSRAGARRQGFSHLASRHLGPQPTGAVEATELLQHGGAQKHLESLVDFDRINAMRDALQRRRGQCAAAASLIYFDADDPPDPA